MSARHSILQRLRAIETSGSKSSINAPPATIIGGDVIAHFKEQAAKSGADIRHLNTGETLEDVLPEPAHKESIHCAEAIVAIAETGSVVLHSHENASEAIYLCEHLVVTIAEHNIIRHLDEALDKLSHINSRALHVITGPSRTADVEQTIQIGAHGPRLQTLVIYRQD